MIRLVRPSINRLADLVESDGRTRHEIADAVGMSKSQLSQILNGHKANPSIGTFERILTALGKTWADLDE